MFLRICEKHGNASLHHFSKDGKLLRTVGGPGNKPGEFRLPHSLWIDDNGLVWVADRDNYRIEVFDGQGDLVKCFDPIYPYNIPYGLSTLWGNEQYVFCSQDSRGIVVYDVKALNFVGFIAAPNGSPILGHSLCGDSEGSLYTGNLHPDPMVTKLIRIQ